MDDCPFGCPCDSYDCKQDKKSVLVLNFTPDSNKQVLIKFDGDVKTTLTICFILVFKVALTKTLNSLWELIQAHFIPVRQRSMVNYSSLVVLVVKTSR